MRVGTSSKAAKFYGLQLRSLLEDGPVGTDKAWARVLTSKELRFSSDTDILLMTPTSAEAEGSFLAALEALAQALQDLEALKGFYRHFGWSSASEYFDQLGEDQVMLVDLDHNDLDDRLAIILLAHQMASANLERRQQAPESKCTLYLDARTYENSGLTVWRTLRLAARLHAILHDKCGLAVEPVFKDGVGALGTASSYLNSHCTAADEVEQLAPGAAATLQGGGPGAVRHNFLAALVGDKGKHRRSIAVWVLSGICKEQVEDIQVGCSMTSGGAPDRFVIIEQAQAAWHSGTAPAGAEQPDWDWPPSDPAELDKGYGAEPSNIRSGELSYPEIIDAYMFLQQIVAGSPGKFTYICPALARAEGTMPGPVGQTMRRVWGRPLNVLPGPTYTVKRATDTAKAMEVFAKLVDASRDRGLESVAAATLQPEICQGPLDDAGRERQEVAHIVKYGTNMPDGIIVALAARPFESLGAVRTLRRLAALQVDESLAFDAVAGEVLQETPVHAVEDPKVEFPLDATAWRWGCIGLCAMRTD